MCNMSTERIKSENVFLKNVGLYFTDGFDSDGSVVKGLKQLSGFKQKTAYYVYN